MGRQEIIFRIVASRQNPPGDHRQLAHRGHHRHDVIPTAFDSLKEMAQSIVTPAGSSVAGDSEIPGKYTFRDR